MSGILTKEIIIRRLAYSRYLVELAKRQIDQTEPLGFAGLLLIHDAIEMVLHLGAAHHKLKTPQNLMDYWQEFNNAQPRILLESKGAIDRLNKARVNFKHHGNTPSKRDLNEFMIIAQSFLVDSVKRLFELEYDTISLCDLVEYQPSRKHLKLAEKNLSLSPEEALGDIAVAFEAYISYFQRRHSSYGGAFDRRPALYEVRATLDGTKRSQAPEYLKKVIDKIYDEIDLIRLGIDYIDYAKYKLCVPGIFITMGGQYHIRGWRTDVPTSDSAKFAHNFVIEQILRLQQRSFDTKYTHGRLTLSTHEEKDDSDLYSREDRVITIKEETSSEIGESNE